MLRNIFFYHIIFSLIYNIRSYYYNKKKFTEIFFSLKIMNKDIHVIKKKINNKQVTFRDNNNYNNLDIDENSYSSSSDDS